MADGTGKRVALVIGNGAYEDATPLHNPTNDAKAVAAALKTLDFELITVDGATDYNADLGLINMVRALADFSVATEAADTAIFYFAGHGLEVDGRNYLLPKDARLSREKIRRIYFETVKLADVRTAIEHASHMGLILLDACRNDPFRVPMRGLQGEYSGLRGFASIEPSGNTGIAYAARHGTTASDGKPGKNSPFANALLKHLPTPDLEVRLLFGRIKDEVWKATAGEQEPHFYSNFGGQPLFLVPNSQAPATISEVPEPTETLVNDNIAIVPVTAMQQAKEWWAEFRIDETEDPEQIEAYIQQIDGKVPLMAHKARQRLDVVQGLLRQREAVAWQAASATNTEAAFEDYLAAWPSGAHVADTNARIAQLREDARWQAVLGAGGLEGFRDYLRDYPRGRYVDEAQRRISEIEEAERRKREERERAEAEARAKAEAEHIAREQEEDRRAGVMRFMVGAGGGRDEVQRIKPGSGESFQDAPFAPEMVVVPKGSFMMGTKTAETEALIKEYGKEFEKYFRWENPQHKVIIPHAFAVGRHAVTFDEWDACVADGGCKHKPETDWGRGDQPVMRVSWNDAKAYVKWLSQQTGKEYRLLTEAEWEYAARAGTTTRYWWGDEISKEQANYGGNIGKTVPVNKYQPNPWGLYQVHGNVWEWCEDVWHKNCEGAPTDGSAWLKGGDANLHVVRGGSWFNFAWFLRSACRDGSNSDYRFNDAGFRIARTLTS